MKDYRKMLEDIGGYDNEMMGIPVAGVKEIIDEVEQLRIALAFYRDEAESIARHFDKNDDAVLASVTVLKLDAGCRAKALLNRFIP